LQAESKILKKIIGTPNLPIKTKNFLKKYCVSYLKSRNEANICPDGTCRPDPKSKVMWIKKFADRGGPMKKKISSKNTILSIQITKF
jgi:hypothetical protein